MPQLTPLRTGAAFALTVAALYLACSLLMLLALASAAATLRHGGSVLPLWCRALLA